jgi:hypothetical protein
MHRAKGWITAPNIIIACTVKTEPSQLPSQKYQQRNKFVMILRNIKQSTLQLFECCLQVESGAGLKLVGVSELFTGGKRGWVEVGWGK